MMRERASVSRISLSLSSGGPWEKVNVKVQSGHLKLEMRFKTQMLLTSCRESIKGTLMP